ncbi:uncharacterized protein C9orf85 homolog [Pseudochaenichthys georgianus]|uniref:uncharacterized protein C9orf85 homolog n=1 Tax=Pseudochaenichthys georgianus TaxID=52239 RepID=UPI00146B9ADC|nr:uncharacterized protein C9orf85 homolog isoform X1 [Pseudochaenichthys georgianus]
MSSQKGNVSRSRAQKHKNNTAFVNNKYGATVQVQKANSKIHDGLCKHCKGVLEWRVRYNKYKSLTQPKKCIKCAQRTVKDAYHILCKPCSLELDICCKCGKKEKIVIPINSGDNNDEEGGEEEEGEEKDEEKGEVKEEVKGEEKGEEKNEEKGEEKVVEQKKKVRVRAKKDLDDSDSDDDDDDDEEREDLHSGSKSKKTQNKSDDLPDVSRLQVRFND